MALTKKDVIDKVPDELGLAKKDSLQAVETLLELIKGALAEGEDVLVSGFGKFAVKGKKARKGRNPATGGNMILRGRRIVTFKCSGVLRDKISGG